MSQKKNQYKWTIENVRILIQHLKDAPVLWQKNHPNKNSNYIFNVESKKIARKMGLDLELIKNKIHTLKMQFQLQHKRKMALKESSEQGWYAYDQLKFLLDDGQDLTADDEEKRDENLDISIKEEDLSSDGQSSSMDGSNNTAIPYPIARDESDTPPVSSWVQNQQRNILYSGKEKWPKVKVIRAIDFFRKAPSLWDTKDPDSKNPVARQIDLENMANLLQTTPEAIQRKIKMFKDQFRREHRRQLDPETSHEKSWFAYEHLLFLADNESNNFENMDDNASDSDLDFDNNQSFRIKDEVLSDPDEDHLDSGTSNYATTSNISHPIVTHNTESTSKRANSLPTKSGTKNPPRTRPATWRYDSFSVYGENVACRMRNSLQSWKAVVTAMHHIDQILYNLEMDVYDQPQQPVQQAPQFFLSVPAAPSTSMPLTVHQTTQQILQSTAPLNIQSFQAASMAPLNTQPIQAAHTQQILQPNTPLSIQPIQTTATQQILQPNMPLNMQPIQATQQILQPNMPLNIQPMQTTQQILQPNTTLKIQPMQTTQQILQSNTPLNIQPLEPTEILP